MAKEKINQDKTEETINKINYKKDEKNNSSFKVGKIIQCNKCGIPSSDIELDVSGFKEIPADESITSEWFCPKCCREQLEEITDLTKRTQANFENYRKQVEKRVEEIQDLAAKDLILQLLPVLDNLELALESVDKNLVEFRKGIELIYSQLFSILEAQGVKVIEAKKFDPYFHEPLLKVESEAPENSILEEFQKGFMLNNRVIRHAKVKLSAGKKKESSSDKDKTLEMNPKKKDDENQTQPKISDNGN